jgi:hypothetical protein
MTHQQAMQATTSPSNCMGEITKGNQGTVWTLGTCTCGTQIALRSGLPHRENCVVAEMEPSRVYRQVGEGLEVSQ